MDTSTPKWCYREPTLILDTSTSPVTEPTPDDPSDGSNAVVMEETLKETVGSEGNLNKSLGLSHQGMKLLISPGDDDQLLQMKKFVQETINLTRAAIWRGLISYEGSEADLNIPIHENAM